MGFYLTFLLYGKQVCSGGFYFFFILKIKLGPDYTTVYPRCLFGLGPIKSYFWKVRGGFFHPPTVYRTDSLTTVGYLSFVRPDSNSLPDTFIITAMKLSMTQSTHRGMIIKHARFHMAA